jgi:hypothetical protein
MQNCVALATEVAELETRGFGSVAVVTSGERWNPVAAVVLRDLEHRALDLGEAGTHRLKLII